MKTSEQWIFKTVSALPYASVIMCLLSVTYRQLRSVLHQIRNKKLKENTF